MMEALLARKEGNKDEKKEEIVVDTEYVEKTKKSLVEIFELLEKDEYEEAVNSISEMHEGGSLDPLKKKIEEKRIIFDIMTEIMKKAGRYRFKDNHNYGDPEPDPNSLLFNSLSNDEKLWYQISFKDDYSRRAPKTDFETLFDLIERYPDFGRKKIIQMYFFGFYFGVKDITDEQIHREGLGLALERGRRFTLSWNFRGNVPFEYSPFIHYRENRLIYINDKQDLFKVVRSDGAKNEEMKIVFESGKDVIIMDRYRRQQRYYCGHGAEFPGRGYSRYGEEEEEEENVKNEKRGTYFKMIPDQILHFFSFNPDSGSLGNILSLMVKKRNLDTLGKIFRSFPKSILSSIKEDSYHNHGTTPLFFTVLETRDFELINLFLDGFGDASAKHLAPALKTMQYTWYGSGSHHVPLAHKIFLSFNTAVCRYEDIHVGREEIGVENWREMEEINQAIRREKSGGGSCDSDDSESEEEESESDDDDDDIRKPPKKSNKKKKKGLSEEMEEKKEKYLRLKKERFEKKHREDTRRRKEGNENMIKLYTKLAHLLDWNALETTTRRYGFGSKESLIEKIIKFNNLEIAKFLITDLMVDHEGEQPIKEKMNYFEIDDLKLSGEKGSGGGGGRRRKRRAASGGNMNETYKFVLSMRTFWNSANFRIFSREYQHIVCLFVWAVEQRGWFLPQEMVCLIFQYIDFFDFKYIFGKNCGGIYVWEACPDDFTKTNMKMYYHEVIQITEAGQCFKVLRGVLGEMEFKGMIDYCLKNHQKFFTYITGEDEAVLSEDEEEEDDEDGGKEGVEEEEEKEKIKKRKRKRYRKGRYYQASEHQDKYHHGLITVAHHLKKEMYHRCVEKKQDLDVFVAVLVKVMNNQVERDIQYIKGRIQYEKDNQYASRWRRPRGQVDWLNESGTRKHYSIPNKDALPKDAPKLEVLTKRFLEFIKTLC